MQAQNVLTPKTEQIENQLEEKENEREGGRGMRDDEWGSTHLYKCQNTHAICSFANSVVIPKRASVFGVP